MKTGAMMRNRAIRSIAVFLLIIVVDAFAWNVSLQISKKASNGVGGEVLEAQPIIEVFDKKGIKKQDSLVGKVVATLSHSSLDDERLGTFTLDKCGAEADEISVDLVEGVANFSGLCINRSGVGFSIKYTLFDEFDILLGEVTQTDILIEVGQPHTIGAIQVPTNVEGGMTWKTNPIVAVQDRGGNTVEDVNSGAVTIDLENNDNSETLQFQVLHEVKFEEIYQVISPSKLSWENGIAEFDGLSINTVGKGYRLKFTTDVNLPGGNTCISAEIEVSFGEPHALLVIDEPGLDDTFGGKAFIHQPLLHVVDAGGNVVQSDSSSRVVASFFSNPRRSALQPTDMTVVTVDKGVVRFKKLMIAEAAEGYRLQYSLLFAPKNGELRPSNITAVGKSFNVNVGLPEELKILREPKQTWAGNQPFTVQPKVALVDAGGNTLSHVSDLDISAVVTESLSQTSDIIVDTRLDDVPIVTSVQYHPSILSDGRIAYSYGHIIFIIVHFSQEVFISVPSNSNESNPVVPSLTLNIIDDTGVNAKAYLSEPFNLDVPNSYLSFTYRVAVDSEQTMVDILDNESLQSNGYLIRDAWGRQALLSLPFSNSTKTLTNSKVIIVHNQPASITQIAVSLSDGEYGAGQEVDFVVDFTHEVAVDGNPHLPLKVKSVIALVDTQSLGTSLSTSYFYIWYKNERSKSIPWNASSAFVKNVVEGMESVTGDVCVSRAMSVQSQASGGYRWAIRFDGMWDDLYNNFSTEHAPVYRDHKAISLSTNLLVMHEPVADWVREDGDETMCTFRYAKYLGGSGSSLLSFKFLSLPGDTSSKLSLSSPASLRIVSGMDKISNALNDGTPSNLYADLVWNNELSSSIAINSASPKIIDFVITGTVSLGQTLHAGDILFFQVYFDQPITVSDSLQMKLDNVRYKGAIAKYYSKPTSKSATFKYVVLQGHWTSDLMRQNPDSVYFDIGSEKLIQRESTLPVTEADLVIPWSDLTDLPLIKIDGRAPRITSIQYAPGQKAFNFGRGDKISIEVHFSSPISLLGGTPVLVINAGSAYNEAVYDSGNQTAMLTFIYTVETGDGSTPLACRLLCVASGCYDGASKEGYIFQMSSDPNLNANLLMPDQDSDKGAVLYVLEDPLQIDTSNAPETVVKSVEVWHNGGVVAVGEVVRIQVKFSDKVYCKGTTKPELQLNVHNRGVYESGTGTRVITFRLRTTLMDVVNELNWDLFGSTSSSIICDSSSYSPCSIVNGNDALVNLSFVDNETQPIIQNLTPTIKVSSLRPSIVSVHSGTYELEYCQSVCKYTAGDFVTIFVTFDQPITVIGHPRIKLYSWDDKGRNVYAVYDSTLSSEFAVAFKYNILPGHTSKELPLSYLQENIYIGAMDAIKRTSTFPSLDANVLLPDANPNELRSEGGNLIIVEAEKVPRIKQLSFGNETGSYSPGDRILIKSEFDDVVSIEGTPVLLLDVGRGLTGCAVYHDGTNTKEIWFRYDVGLSHCSTKVDYVNRYSLETKVVPQCQNEPGTVRRASANPIINANLMLPDPGGEGSLSVDKTLLLDCRIPYVSRLWSPQSPGRYHTADKISILVKFSRAVDVRGTPSIILETGEIDRKATFKSQLDSTTLEFEYEVMLGDLTYDLDYWADEGIQRSSVASFQLLGGSVIAPATNAIMNADVHINPAFGHLDGLSTNIITEGEAEYLGLKIGKRGVDYKIRFSASSAGGKFDAETIVAVGESCEFELNGNGKNRDAGDKFGSTMSLQNDLLAVGAPNKKVPTAEVQVLRLESEAIEIQREVQLITTNIDRDRAIKVIQSFNTYALEEVTIGGYFTIGYNDPDSSYEFSRTVRFPSDVDDSYMKQRLTETFPVFGNIDIVRIKNLNCTCFNAWTWTVTFFDASGGIGPLITEGSELEGAGSQVSSSQFIKQTHMLGGSFTLQNSLTSIYSRSISYKASALEVKSAIEEDLGISVFSVQGANIDFSDIPELGRRWTVIFSSHVGPYGEDVNVPNLIAKYDQLTGANAGAWVHIGSEGKSPLSGSFAVSMRGSDFSDFIRYDASIEELKEAIESLDSVNEVTVSDRRPLPFVSGYEWIITFESVNVLTDYGWVLDVGATSSFGNLPPLEIKSNLIGWKIKSTVENEFGSGPMDTQAQWMAKNMGDDGINSGEVVIYKRASDGWKVEQYLSAADRSANDNFGHSVSLNGNIVAVGAPHKEVTGVSEQQTITCLGNPTGGTFNIKLRGHRSDDIPFDSSLEAIRSAVQGVYGSTLKVHPLPAFELEKNGHWASDDSGFCSSPGNSFTLTLLTPDGGGKSTIDGVSGDIEPLKIEKNIIGGSIEIVESRKGSRVLSGSSKPSILGSQSGTVYLFERKKSCDFCQHKWYQVQSISQLDCLEVPEGSEQFGWSVAFLGDILLVGSPGFHNNTGKVYTFRKDDQVRWKCAESLTSSVRKNPSSGDRFGFSLATNERDTVLIGSPGNAGGVSVFRQNLAETQILFSQKIEGPLELTTDSRFGHAVAIHDNQAVICAPYQHDGGLEHSGSCFTYERISSEHRFTMNQKLIASNVQKHDRFGWGVSITIDKILVGQLQKYTGKLAPQGPVQKIRTSCGHETCKQKLGSTFKLSWRDGFFKTRPLSHSISAKQLKQALEEDLETGIVHVTRTEFPDKNGGYEWAVTFISHGDSRLSDSSQVPTIHCDSASLSGSMPLCDIDIQHPKLKSIRGKAHLFTNNGGGDSVWLEQAYLYPEKAQPQDFFGNSVFLFDNTAVVGAPYRSLLNINSGAAMIFNLSFANFYFSSSNFNVREGDILMLPVHKRKSVFDNQILGVESLDINADDDAQRYVQKLWGQVMLEEETTIGSLVGTSALTNDQYYGGIDNRSEWVSGMFDYRGMNDYQSIKEVTMVESDKEFIMVKTSNDQTFEAPDETLIVQVALPGMFASPLGQLRTEITITDDGDGFVGNETHYTKLYGISTSPQDNYRPAVAMLQDEDLLVVGNGMHSKGGGHCNGIAHLYVKKGGKWTYLVELIPPTSPVKDSNFGQSVSISKPFGRNDITVLVGEPGQVVAHVFVYNTASLELEYQSELRPFGISFVTAEHKFASRGAIAINGDVAFVGASKLETVFVYRRIYSKDTNSFSWHSWTTLKSDDYDYDKYDKGYSVKHVHEQRFGMSIVATDRHLLVSAPYSDYGNRGDLSVREHFNTDGLYNVGLGKGKVYAFHSQPYIFQISCQLQGDPYTSGSFKLSLRDYNISTAEISCDVESDNMAKTMENLPMMGKVLVLHNHESNGEHDTIQIFSWYAVMLSIFDSNPPSIEPTWYGNNCQDCEVFKVANGTVINPHITVKMISSLETFSQEGILQGDDVTSGDCFGCSVDFTDDQAIVGAPFSSAKTRTTWDFETGNLVGWFATGDAFLYQPTYGDNSRRRMVYSGYERIESSTTGGPQTSKRQGRYYIGTYEKRPGNKTDYLMPDNDYSEGDIQGDKPTGSLTSDPFMIQGDYISFLIGGGCDHFTEYVELIIDGFATMRATGKCSETMYRVRWNVAVHKDRAAQIKIVDASSRNWGHINVDHIEFSWIQNGKGSSGNTGGAIQKDDSLLNKQHYSGREESPKAGSAYIFKRECTDWLAKQQGIGCTWTQDQRIVPSDKRAKNLFGTSVSINSSNGNAIVGSPFSPVYGFYKESPSMYPFDESLFDFPVDPRQEPFLKSGNILAETPGNLRLLDHLERNLTKPLPVILPKRYTENAGAIYTFLQLNEEQLHDRQRSSWHITETARIAPPDIRGNTLFGSTVSMAKTAVIVGAETGDAAFVFGLKWQNVRFTSIEYVGLEGTDSEVTVTVIRDTDDEHVSVGYSSSDLTALGIDELKMDECVELDHENRSGCGDYEQSVGVLEFAKGQKIKSFQIRITDDNCWERHMEYVQLNLHIPGGAAIQGEQFRAQLRIDDNDWDAIICPEGIS